MDGRWGRADWRVDGRVDVLLVVVVAVERRAGRTGCRQTGGDVTAFGIVFDADAQVVVVAGRAVARRLGKVLQPLTDLLVGGSDRRGNSVVVRMSGRRQRTFAKVAAVRVMDTAHVVAVVVAFGRHWAGSVVAVGSGVETVAAVRMADGTDGRQRSDDALAVVQVGGQLVVFAGFVHAGHEALLVAILEHVCLTKLPSKSRLLPLMHFGKSEKSQVAERERA